ncbi:hypothetical protein HK096_001681, partial [Nowakowskiella sp. JEL0078]
FFELKIIQQPKQARICGFNDKDRRKIDPPPIIQLLVKDLNGKTDSRYLQYPYFVLHTTLIDSVTKNEVENISSEFPEQNETSNQETLLFENHLHYNQKSISEIVTNEDEASILQLPNETTLIGSLIASANTLYDLRNRPGIFFIFADLSIRWGGVFHLRFTLSALGTCVENSNSDQTDIGNGRARVDLNCSLSSQGSTRTIATIITEPFTVYSPRTFPGKILFSI